MQKAGEVTYAGAHGHHGFNRGVVCYKREDGARRAVEELDGRYFCGQKIKLVFRVREEWGGDVAGNDGRGRFRSDSRGQPRSRSRSPRTRDNKSHEKSLDRSLSKSKSIKREPQDFFTATDTFVLDRGLKSETGH